MKPQYILVIASCSALLLGAGCMGKTNAPPASTPMPVEQSAEQPVATAPTSTKNQPDPALTRTPVMISGMAFTPSSVTIKVGSIIDWTNKDRVAHTITFDDGSVDSGSITKGGKYPHLFVKPGTYTYHCSIHPSMKGTIVVE